LINNPQVASPDEMVLMNDMIKEAQQPERSRVEIADPTKMREFVESAYGVECRRWDARVDSTDGEMTHSRIDLGPVIVDEIALPGVIEFDRDPIDNVIAMWATDGKIVGQSGGLVSEAGPGDITLVSQPGQSFSARTEHVKLTSLLLDPGLVASAASGVPTSQSPLPVRFLSFQPVSEAAGQLWKRTVNFVKNDLLADDTTATPLVIGHACRLLAAVTVATFPSSINGTRLPYDRADYLPTLLRRAIQYVDANAGNDIALADIAEAVHVTPRAVQYMFRRHLDMTPLQYMRGVRLDHAHQELMAGDRMHETVTAIAARWGFLHTGRFAVLYRQTYGQSPHQTLRS
jgi:AraC-like DNA-binding protein